MFNTVTLPQALSAAGKPRMIAQLLSEAAAAAIPDSRHLFDASLSSLLASGFGSQAKTLHTLMVDQGWAPSPACSATPAEPGCVFQWEACVTAAPSLHSIEGNRPQTSSSGCSSCCCTEGDVCELPPAAVEAGRGHLARAKVSEAVRSLQAVAAAPHSRASQTGCSRPAPKSSGSFTFSSLCSAATDSSWAMSFSDTSVDLADRAHSVVSSTSLSVTGSPARSLLSCTSAELLSHAADQWCGTAAEPDAAPAVDSDRPAQAVSQGHKEAPVADSAAASSAASCPGCTTAGMCGPFYAYIPTCGPAGVVYTVAGPYYRDAAHPDRWFAVAFGGSSVAC